ncbi:serine hydrolase domain-containing protein [Clostridium sp. UBA2485]|uniref:serine hydrolase domain-containing protein n=1 Tax=Clostridium sp. UBA2485 TaxID=1946352 RepID=UPI0025C53884|nr:serine hydrolase domain-containing protein [Clostridium sp. UBA2485]
MKKLICMIVLIGILSTFLMGCVPNKIDNSFKKEVKEIADILVSDYDVMSLQYGIMDNGKIVLSDNSGIYGKFTHNEIDQNTMYGTASLSKIYVSAAIMILVDQGKIDIDSPVTKYLPNFKMDDIRYKDITVRMLLNHSSGLYGSHYYNGTTLGVNDRFVQDNLLKNMQNEKLHSNPGEFSVYCNDGFQLLELIVESVSGTSYTEFLEEKINKPLGLKNTKTPFSDFNRDRLAKIYDTSIDKELPTVNINLLGTGGIYSTAEDILRFSEVLMGNKEEILSKKSALRMQEDEYKNGIWVEDDNNNTGYGLGWDSTNLWPFSKYGIKAIIKGGDGSYHSSLIVLPEYNISMAVVSSDGLSIYNQAFASTVLIKYLKEKNIVKDVDFEEKFEEPKAVEILNNLFKYEGIYGNGTVSGVTYEIKFDKNSFIMPERLDGLLPSQKFVYVGNEEFKTEDGTMILKFIEAKNNKIYMQTKGYLNLPGVGQFLNTEFESVKLDKNIVSETVMRKWKDRENKRYFAIGEHKYSDMYLNYAMLVKKMYLDEESGYILNNKVIDENNGVNSIEIPVANGRDLTDLNFYEKDGVEYLKTIDMTFIKEDFIEPIGNGIDLVKIGENGYAKWFKVDEKSKNKMIEVELPKGGNFAVYDENGQCITLNSVMGENKSKLPENGFIVFVGNKEDVFKIKIR